MAYFGRSAMTGIRRLVSRALQRNGNSGMQGKMFSLRYDQLYYKFSFQNTEKSYPKDFELVAGWFSRNRTL